MLEDFLYSIMFYDTEIGPPEIVIEEKNVISTSYPFERTSFDEYKS
jgi:hypothetical protein